MKIEVPTIKCERCGHVWVPRASEVIRCARCKSPYWAIPRREKGKGKSESKRVQAKKSREGKAVAKESGRKEQGSL